MPKRLAGDRHSQFPSIETAMRFVVWANTSHTPPDPRRVMVRWNVSRATAYRWIAAWRDAMAIEPESERAA